MKKTSGFLTVPKGSLLNRFLDLEHPAAVAYERSIGYDKDFHTHDRLNLAFPRGSSIVKFTTENPTGQFQVDSSTFLWMPANVVHRQDVKSAVYDNFALFPMDSCLDGPAKYLDIEPKELQQLFKKTVKFPRSKLLEELVNLHFQSRVVHREAGNVQDQIFFQILVEILRIVTKRRGAKPATLPQEEASHALLRAVEYIEANLFDELTAENIAAAARMSQASLFRKFKQEFLRTPFDYIRERRLDEAKLLLLSKQYAVGDVGLLVGYTDFTAFSKAFKTKFGASPSTFLADGA